MNICPVEQNTYFAKEENRADAILYPNDFLLESVALRLYAETYLDFSEDGFPQNVDHIYRQAFEFAKDSFITGGYFNFVDSIHSEFGWIEKLFLFKNGTVGAVITPYTDEADAEEEEERKLYIIELY